MRNKLDPEVDFDIYMAEGLPPRFETFFFRSLADAFAMRAAFSFDDPWKGCVSGRRISPDVRSRGSS